MGTIRCCLGLHFRLLLLLNIAGISFSRAYPLPPAFAYQPSQHQLAMAAAGLEPIMPVNYPGLSTTSSPSMMSAMNQQQQGTSNSKSNSAASSSAFASPTVVPLSALFAGNRAVDIVSAQQQQLALQQIYAQQQQPQLYIRNSPFQAPLRGFSSAGGGIQQPIFPHGLAMGKTAYGLHPSAAILPSDIPMDVLIGRQVLQNGLDEAGAGYRHPFPFNSAILGTEHQQMPQGQPQPNSLSSSSFGGSFGAEQKPTEQTEPQEFEQSRTEHIPPQPTQQQQQQLAPASELSAQQPHPPIISAEPTSSPPSSPPAAYSAAATQSEQSSLPVFLRGASQEFIEEFKQIIRQPNSTYAAQVSRIDALVQRMDPERQLLYREFMRENDDRERLHRDRVHKTVAEMSDKAQEQFAKISATLRNPNVADQDRWERVLQLYGKMDTELRNEFEQKFKGFPTIGPATAGT